MNRGTKIGIVGAVLTGLFWKYSRLPKIKVLQILPPDSRGIIYQPPGVVFEMSCNGNVFRDTFYQGDERQVILSDDMEYYFISDPTETGVTLSIGVLNGNGGFDIIATGYIAYDYAGNDLPVRIAGKKSKLNLPKYEKGSRVNHGGKEWIVKDYWTFVNGNDYTLDELIALNMQGPVEWRYYLKGSAIATNWVPEDEIYNNQLEVF